MINTLSYLGNEVSIRGRIPVRRNWILLTVLFTGIFSACAGPSATSTSEKFSQPGSDQIQSQRGYPVFSNRFRSQIEEIEQGDFLPVVIRLKEKAHLQSVTTLQDAVSKSERRSAAITYLKQFASKSQNNIKSGIVELESAGLVRNPQLMWLANVICLDVTPEAIDYLLQFSEIENISGDSNAPLFLQQSAWGVRHINSPEVWHRTSGEITGDGVVVAVLDSGADLDHPDLRERFWINSAEDLNGDGQFTRIDKNGVDDDGNGFVDDVVGWDFESEDSDPSPSLFESGRARGHGTHVAGIIAGDGSNGIATGVAPGAKLMILKINSQRSVWAAMQYALTNGADILNMSIGWTQSQSPDLGTWRDIVDNLTDAGILVVAGAGSGGQAPMVHSPAPEDITTPGRVPRALTVAAVAEPSNQAWLDPVAKFSSVGPISWQTVRGFGDYPFPPGLMKPDVSAPGVNITSTMIGGSYQTKSGASMAVAHVSGVAALLLEQDPNLLPHELVFNLRESAWRFAGPNDVRGWGRVDALNAINFRRDSAAYDIAVEQPDRLWQTESIWIDNDGDGNPDEPVAGMGNRVYARVKNRGGHAIGNAEMRFYYAGAGTRVYADDAQNLVRDDRSSFEYIGSYYAPLIGPAGSSQDTVVGAVEWITPNSRETTRHWSLAVEVVGPTPPNVVESDRTNNSASRNYFKFSVAPGQVLTFNFFIHGDPRQTREPFDLEVMRDGLPQDFDVELSLDEVTTEKWVERMRGFEPVNPIELAEFPVVVAANASKSVRLLRDRGQLERIVLSGGEPVLARIVIRAPEIDSDVYSIGNSTKKYLVVNTANDNGIFGGLALDIEIDEDASQVNQLIYVRK